jgi:hypothetical protein
MFEMHVFSTQRVEEGSVSVHYFVSDLMRCNLSITYTHLLIPYVQYLIQYS